MVTAGIIGSNEPLYGALPQDDVTWKPVPRPRTNWKRYLVGALVVLFLPLAYILVVYIPHSSIYQPVPMTMRVKEFDHHDLHHGARLVIVGDVHGSYKPLKKLLKKVDFKKKSDILLLLGDFITKGPDSIKVLDYAMEVDALCVRGNHENEILHMYSDYHNLPAPKIKAPEGQEHNGSEFKGNFDREDDKKLVKRITPEQAIYMANCPIIMSLGNISETGLDSYAVHGGLSWHITNMEYQDPEMVMTVRSLLPPDYIEWSEEDDGVHWSHMWNKKQLEVPMDERRVVFYGHDARSGLNIKEYTKGLDSRCVAGNKLSAYVVSLKEGDNFNHEFVSVKC